VGTALQVFERMQAAGVDANAYTHHQLVEACVVAGATGLAGRPLVHASCAAVVHLNRGSRAGCVYSKEAKSLVCSLCFLPPWLAQATFRAC
jgi:hypothetical protein